MIIPINRANPALTASFPAANTGSSRQAYSAAPANNADRVSISQAARERLTSESAVPPDAYPLEYYALPKWLADLIPVELSGKLGARADELYVKGGHLVGTYDRELAEYSGRLQSHFQTLQKREGIDSLPEYNQAMHVDQESSARLHQLFKESLAVDPRMTELMAVLNIPFPT